MNADLVLAVDCSTTGCKALLFDRCGHVVAQGSAPIELHNPAPGGWEQDAEGWWTAFVASVRQVAGYGSRIASLAVTHQRETFVLCQPDGTPLAPAIVWMDERATAQVERLRGRDAHIHRETGKPVCLTPSVYKAMWQRETQPALYVGDVVVADVHAFLMRKLLGRFVTSVGSADPMGLVDMAGGRWSPDMTALLGPGVALPDLCAVGEGLGGLSAAAASATGLPQGLSVVATAGDGQCAGLGAHIAGLDRAYLNLGTAVVSGVCGPDYVVDRAFRTLFAALPGAYQFETDLKGGTFTLNWLAGTLLGSADVGATLAELEGEAQGLPPGAEGVFCVPYFCGVMNPYWDDAAGGAFVGLRGDHGPAHLYRAVLEGLAMEQRLHTDAVQAATGVEIGAFVVMGGGSRSDLFCQIVADATGRVVERAGTAEATALGAAILGAVAAGIYGSVEEAAAAMTTVGQRFSPGPGARIYADLFERYAGLYPALAGVSRFAS